MNRAPKTFVLGVTTLGVLAAPTAAFATTLDVYKPCGCHVVDQQVGVPETSPAIDNPTSAGPDATDWRGITFPTSTVGNANNDSRTYEACFSPTGDPCYRNSSAVVYFH
jgi:hypothetical protein